MQIAAWNPIYATGIAIFDQHHQRLISLLNDAYNSLAAGAAPADQRKILDELCAYADYHFAAEEEAMDRRHYPGMAAHIAEHDAFRVRVGKLQEQLTAGQAVVDTELLLFLEEWLINHILKVDKEYATALQGLT